MKELILYALRRFCMLIPFLIGLTLVAFLLGVLSPGDPALALLTMDGTSEPTAEELDALRHAMGLDQPVWIQYGRWLMNALHGDLGVSYLTQKPVLNEILRRFPITFHLAVWAIGWVMVTGIPAGIWAAGAAHAFYHEKTCTAQCPCPRHYDARHFLRRYLGRIRHH